MQWEIFRKIFYESREGNRIYLIGDPKQAIYAFRGADVYTYLDARKDICGDARPVPLDENFRSTERLIRAYNLLLDQQAAPPFFTDEQIRYDAPVRSGLPDLDAVDSEGTAHRADHHRAGGGGQVGQGDGRAVPPPGRAASSPGRSGCSWEAGGSS